MVGYANRPFDIAYQRCMSRIERGGMQASVRGNLHVSLDQVLDDRELTQDIRSVVGIK